MQPKILEYRGYIIKIVAHILPSSFVSTFMPLKYVVSLAIIADRDDKLSDHIRWIHPNGFFMTPDQAFEAGAEHALQLINKQLALASAREGKLNDSSAYHPSGSGLNAE